MPIATTEILGGVMPDGTTITVDENGVISGSKASAGSTVQPVYFSNGKPVACTYTLGKSVPSNAKFTDTVYKLPKATTSVLGGVMPDGTTITVDENGVISGSSNSFGTVGGLESPVYFSDGVPHKCSYRIWKGSITVSTGGTARYGIKHNRNFTNAPYVFLQVHIPDETRYSSEYGAHIYKNDENEFSLAYNLPANSTIYYFLIGNSY